MISVNIWNNVPDSHTGSLVKQDQSRAWISYINDTDLTGYLVYTPCNCPFDYCISTSPPFYNYLNNQPNGAEAQCAFNWSSLLYRSCLSGLSFSLGSSPCLLCPSYWPALATRSDYHSCNPSWYSTGGFIASTH